MLARRCVHTARLAQHVRSMPRALDASAAGTTVAAAAGVGAGAAAGRRHASGSTGTEPALKLTVELVSDTM